MRYHCYTGYRESVYSEDVEAGSPAQAAEEAARKSSIPGVWSVIPLPGETVRHYEVTETHVYQATEIHP